MRYCWNLINETGLWHIMANRSMELGPGGVQG